MKALAVEQVVKHALSCAKQGAKWRTKCSQKRRSLGGDVIVGPYVGNSVGDSVGSHVGPGVGDLVGVTPIGLNGNVAKHAR